MVINSGFPTVNVGNDRNSDCLSIYLIYGVLSFLWKHDTFLAVYCTLLSNSYIKLYIYRKQQHKKRKKRKKEKKKERELGWTRTLHLLLDASTPNRYTTEADYVSWGKSL